MKYYISLGVDCEPNNRIRRAGKRITAFPFDWCVTPMQTVIHHIETKFEDLLREENLVFLEPVKRQYVADDGIMSPEISEDIVVPVFCKKTKTFFPHDFSVKGMDELAEVQEKYARRVSRLYDAFADNSNTFNFIAWNRSLNPNSWRAEKYKEVGWKYRNEYAGWERRFGEVLKRNHPEVYLRSTFGDLTSILK